jgi:hypothetical protein
MGKGRTDEFSPFRLFISHAVTRMKYTKRKEMFCDLDLSYLKSLWDKQNGICPYTGIKMILYPTPQQKRTKNAIQASLDRIDSSKGYIKGNVEFVCLAINYAKNGFSKQEMLDFLSILKNQ